MSSGEGIFGSESTENICIWDDVTFRLCQAKTITHCWNYIGRETINIINNLLKQWVRLT